jgi:potassium efflux system protein
MVFFIAIRAVWLNGAGDGKTARMTATDFRLRYVLALFWGLFLLAQQAFAFDPAILGQAERAAVSLRQDLTRIQNELSLPTLSSDQLTDFRRQLDNIRTSAVRQSESLKDPLAEVDQQLKSIGPTPADGSTEPQDIAGRRADLEKNLARIKTAQTQLELITVETDQQIARVTQLQRDQFLSRLFQRTGSILSPSLWYEGLIASGIFFTRLGQLLANWWSEASRTGDLIVLIIMPLLLGGLFYLYRMIRRWFMRRYGATLFVRKPPDDTDRLWRIVRGVVFTAVIGIALLVTTFLGFGLAGIFTARFEQLFSALVDLLFFPAVYSALAYRLAAPNNPAYRVINLDDKTAGRFALLASIAAFLSQAKNFFTEIADVLYLPTAFQVTQGASISIALIAIIATILIVTRNQEGLSSAAHGGAVYFSWTRQFVPLIWLLLAISLIALCLGYTALASFITEQTVDTAFLIVGLLLVHHLSDALVVSGLDSASSFGQFLRRLTGLGDRGVSRLSTLFRTFIDLALVFVGLPLLFLSWTVTWISFSSLIDRAFDTFKIGDISISLSSIALIVAILIIGLIITRLVTQWLNARVLSQTKVDTGVRDSIVKGANYAGYVAAIGFALSAAGLDFSNLAIIAGALGVGIGFGLQSIVNNFLSGLILLAERPVRAGDWVDVKGSEGLVKQINVRSTEIETFDNCTIIVPNSLLITEPVKNWTHHDTIGRFVVAIVAGVSADPMKVKEIILKAAKDHALVLYHPEPLVMLRDFGKEGFIFDLKAYVGDIMSGAAVASDIRLAVLAAFKENDISLPTVARDVPVSGPEVRPKA